MYSKVFAVEGMDENIKGFKFKERRNDEPLKTGVVETIQFLPSWEGAKLSRNMVKHLFFNREFENLILSGRKKSTIRLGRIVGDSNETIYLHCEEKLIAKARVKAVTCKKLKDLTDEDALKDGFKKLPDLLMALKKYYGKLNPEKEVTIIEFKVEEDYTKKYPDRVRYCGLTYEQIAFKALKEIKELKPSNREALNHYLIRKSIAKTAKDLGVTNRKLKRVFFQVYKELLRMGVLEPEKCLRIENVYLAKNKRKF